MNLPEAFKDAKAALVDAQGALVQAEKAYNEVANDPAVKTAITEAIEAVRQAWLALGEMKDAIKAML